MYGTQAALALNIEKCLFENDVNMYGTQARLASIAIWTGFENDVNMYGTQATGFWIETRPGLRMM